MEPRMVWPLGTYKPVKRSPAGRCFEGPDMWRSVKFAYLLSPICLSVVSFFLALKIRVKACLCGGSLNSDKRPWDDQRYASFRFSALSSFFKFGPTAWLSGRSWWRILGSWNGIHSSSSRKSARRHFPWPTSFNRSLSRLVYGWAGRLRCEACVSPIADISRGSFSASAVKSAGPPPYPPTSKWTDDLAKRSSSKSRAINSWPDLPGTIGNFSGESHVAISAQSLLWTPSCALLGRLPSKWRSAKLTPPCK